MKRGLLKIKPYIFSLLLILIVVTTNLAFADMYINLVAVNGSDQTKDSPIKYYLPKELTPEDIVDTAGLDVDYDIGQQAYFVSGSITLGPKESKTLKITVHDVWKVSQAQVDEIKKLAEENSKRVANTDDAEQGKVLKENINKQLEEISRKQEEHVGNVDRRIEQYRADVDKLSEIKEVVQSVEYWEGKKGNIVPSKVGKDYKGKVVRFVIDVENPAANPKKMIKQQHYLPAEIREEHLVDAQGFEFRFDEAKKQGYLAKEEEFEPGQKKHYVVEIKDIWNIPDEDVKVMNDRTDTTYDEIQKSPYGKEYLESAEELKSAIIKNLGDISKLQKEKKNMKNHIGAYRVNQKRFTDSRDELESLEKILARVRQKRLEELEKSRVKNVLQKLQSLNGIEEISKAIFGKKPTKTTTWRIIIGTLIFVGLFTAFHFLTWQSRSKAGKLKEVERKKPAAKV